MCVNIELVRHLDSPVYKYPEHIVCQPAAFQADNFCIMLLTYLHLLTLIHRLFKEVSLIVILFALYESL